MTKLRFLQNFLLYLLISLFILPVFLVILTQIPFVQNFLTKKTRDLLTENLNTYVELEKVYYGFPYNIVIKKLYVEDCNLDTLFYVKKLKLQPFSFDFQNYNFRFLTVKIEQPKIKIVYDTLGTSNLDFFLENLPSSEKQSDTSSLPFNITFEKIKLENGTFVFEKQNADTLPEGQFNPDFFRLEKINFFAKDVYFSQDSLSIAIKNFSFREKNGFSIDTTQAQIRFNDKNLIVNDLNIVSKQSFISGNAGLYYDKKEDLQDFANKVAFRINISEANVYLKDFATFNPDLKNSDLNFGLNLQTQGTVNNFIINELNIFLGKNTLLSLYGEITGLGQTENFYFDLNMPVFESKNSEIFDFITQINPALADSMPSQIKKISDFNISARTTGLTNNFTVNLDFTSNVGNIRAYADIVNDTALKNIKGFLYADNLDLANLLENKELGLLSLTDTIDLTLQNENLKGATSLKISKFVLKNYLYDNITLKGNFTDKSFDGHLKIIDSNLMANFQGKFDLTEGNLLFDFKLDLDTMQLYNLHFIKDDPDASLKFAIISHFSGKDFENLVGEAHFTKPLILIKNLQLFRLDTFQIVSKIKSFQFNRPYKITTLHTELFEGKFEGIYELKKINKYFANFLRYFLPSIDTLKKLSPDEIFKNDNLTKIKIALNLKNISPLTQIFAPQISIANNTNLLGFLSASDRFFTLTLKSDSVKFSSNKLDDFSFNLTANTKVLQTEIASKKMTVSKLRFENFKIFASTNNDTSQILLAWKNNSGKKNYGKINALFTLSRQDTVLISKIQTAKDTFFVNNVLWNIENLNIINDTILKIKNFTVSNPAKRQQLNIFGKLSDKPADTLNLTLKNFDIKQIQPLIPNLALSGTLQGMIKLFNINSKPAINSHLTVNKLKVNKIRIGTLDFFTQWDNQDSLIDLKLLSYKIRKKNSQIDTLKNVSASGWFKPSDVSYKFDIDIHKLKAKMFQNFTENAVKFNTFSYLKGKIILEGNPVSKKINGNLALFGAFKVVPTGVTYTFNRGLHVKFDNQTIKIDTTVFTGTNMIGDGMLGGTIKHTNFSNFYLKIFLRADTLPVLSIKEERDLPYFGNLFASGNVEIYGYTDDLNINAKIITEDKTDISILLNKPIELTKETSFITFVSDTTKTKKQQKSENQEVKNPTNLNLNLDVKLKENAKFKIIFDKTTGEMLEVQGNGDLNIGMSPYSDMSMYGLITLTKGSYTIVLQNILRKKFLIEKGSTIKWNGSPTDAELNLTTVYKLKAVNLYDLLLDDNYWNEKTPVNCYIHLKGNLLQPEIKFDISLPKADPRIASQISHLDETNKNLQFLSLLVLGKFQPLPGLVYNPQEQSLNPSEFISSQLSAWISQINPNMDMDINYQGTGAQTEQIDVAMSFKLLDERISVNTDIGVASSNPNGPQTNNTGNFIGDVEIEAKLNKKGNIRIKAFNRTNRYDFYERGPYTQGVGLFFKYDFDNLFRRKKKSQKIEP